jgi:hypothetical protein
MTSSFRGDANGPRKARPDDRLLTLLDQIVLEDRHLELK